MHLRLIVTPTCGWDGQKLFFLSKEIFQSIFNICKNINKRFVARRKESFCSHKVSGVLLSNSPLCLQIIIKSSFDGKKITDLVVYWLLPNEMLLRFNFAVQFLRDITLIFFNFFFFAPPVDSCVRVVVVFFLSVTNTIMFCSGWTLTMKR